MIEKEIEAFGERLSAELDRVLDAARAEDELKFLTTAATALAIRAGRVLGGAAIHSGQHHARSVIEAKEVLYVVIAKVVAVAAQNQIEQMVCMCPKCVAERGTPN